MYVCRCVYAHPVQYFAQRQSKADLICFADKLKLMYLIYCAEAVADLIGYEDQCLLLILEQRYIITCG